MALGGRKREADAGPKRFTIVSNPKRHHFLPEFYLSGFTRKGMLSIYDRQKKQYRVQAPRNTAVIGHYYSFLNTSGEVDYSVEKLLSQIEGKAKPVIRKLERDERISTDERIDLAMFLGMLFARVPKAEREAEEIADATIKQLTKHMFPTVDAVAAHLESKGKLGQISPDYFFNFIQNEEYAVKGNRNLAVEMLLEKGPDVGRALAMMDWMVVHAEPRASFITTDSPFGYIVPEKYQRSGEPVLGVASQKITKVIPLTASMALLVGKDGGALGHFEFNRDHVEELNVVVATEADRYVLGADEKLVRKVVTASKIDVARPGTRMRVDHVLHPTDPLRTFTIVRRVPADASDESLKIVVEE